MNFHFSNKLSKYNTSHTFTNYHDLESVNDFHKYRKSKLKKRYYIIGNGSNLLFVRKHIKTPIFKNRLPKYINIFESNYIEVSSTNSVQSVLKYCEQNNFDSFYYLSSVPATIGGAIAMNAGRGSQHNKSILDFVDNITFIDNHLNIKNVKISELDYKYRSTVFSDNFHGFVISVRFRFKNRKNVHDNMINRIKWAKKNQDYRVGNCGSVFKFYNPKIMKSLMGIKLFGAEYSGKTINWIVNNSSSSTGILCLIFITKFLHLIFFQKCKLELKIIF